MKCSLLFVIAFATSALTVENTKVHPLSDEFIRSINSQKKWKAGRNFKPTTSLSQLKNLLGVLPGNDNLPKLPLKIHQTDNDIPTMFDAREAWPECASIIGDIRDQGACASCWAFGAAEAMSDRICIHSNSTVKVSISAEDLLECCFSCGDGCEGGYPQYAWLAWTIPGVVTGGQYGSTEGCKAYSLPPCEHHIEGDLPVCGDMQPTPQCRYECDNTSSIVYDSDLRRGSGYAVFANTLQIQTEIMTNGPVEADFSVYEDFFSYKSGVYQHLLGEVAGRHAVKILGWGEEDDTPYWLVANSWNEEWGDQGYFKILRGSNECGIEESVFAGMPEF